MYINKLYLIIGNNQIIHESVRPYMRVNIDYDWNDLLYGTVTHSQVNNNNNNNKPSKGTNTMVEIDLEEVFEPVACDPSHVCNILFSSGTTGNAIYLSIY